MDSPAPAAGPAPRRASAMRPELLIGAAVLVLVAGVLLFLVWRQSQEAPVPIGDILGDLRKWDGQSVTIKGTVESPTNIFGVVKFFDLRDESGSIKVVTERGLPAEGSEVTVTGIVKQALQVAGMEYTVILEPAGTGTEAE